MSIMRTLYLGLFLTALAAPAGAASLHPNLPAGAAASRIVKIQTGDAAFRIGQLEEQIRGLNGRIEELGFQLLQMQEQMRQMQEDNEFRFQELEKGGGKRSDARPAGPAVTEPGTQQAGNGLPGVEDTTTSSTGNGATGAPPANLGSITFDQNGQMQTGGAAAGAATASLDSPEDLYQAGYNYMLAGDYSLAEGVFRDYVDVYPEGPQAADAMFWLGEAQYSQNNFNEAAKTFLDAHKRYPQADKGPDTLLKLGMSLAAIDKRDTACSTYREVLVRYPGSSPAVRKKVAEEQARASC